MKDFYTTPGVRLAMVSPAGLPPRRVSRLSCGLTHLTIAMRLLHRRFMPMWLSVKLSTDFASCLHFFETSRTPADSLRGCSPRRVGYERRDSRQ
jgi:hypothetical protein